MRKTSYYGKTLGAIEVELRANRHGGKRHVNKIVIGTVRRYAPEEHPDSATMTFTPTREVTGDCAKRALVIGLSQARAIYREQGAESGMAAYDAVVAACDRA